MARLRFTNRVRVCCNVVLPVEFLSSNGQLCLNCLCHSRGQAHLLSEHISVENWLADRKRMDADPKESDQVSIGFATVARRIHPFPSRTRPRALSRSWSFFR